MSRYINAPNFMRNAAIAASVFGIAAFTAACQEQNPVPQLPTREATAVAGPPRPDTNPDFERQENIGIVLQAMKDLNVDRDRDEVALWQSQTLFWETRPSSPAVERYIADNRINAVATGMRGSKNDIYRNAIILTDAWGGIEPVDAITNGLTAANHQIQDETGWHLKTAVSRENVLHGKTIQTTALAIVDIASFKGNILKLMAQFPSLPLQRQFEEAMKLANESQIIKETRAQATGDVLNAFILESALTGYPPVDITSSEAKDLVMFIRFGKNPQDPRWVDYVEKSMSSARPTI